MNKSFFPNRLTRCCVIPVCHKDVSKNVYKTTQTQVQIDISTNIAMNQFITFENPPILSPCYPKEKQTSNCERSLVLLWPGWGLDPLCNRPSTEIHTICKQVTTYMYTICITRVDADQQRECHPICKCLSLRRLVVRRLLSKC